MAPPIVLPEIAEAAAYVQTLIAEVKALCVRVDGISGQLTALDKRVEKFTDHYREDMCSLWDRITDLEAARECQRGIEKERAHRQDIMAQEGQMTWIKYGALVGVSSAVVAILTVWITK